MTTKKYGSQSLIPYLDPDKSKFYIKISLQPEDPAFLKRRINPFVMVSESGPFARIVEARFVTNAGSDIKRIFLLLQKDEYHFSKNELWPVTNQDIEFCWQKAFSPYLNKEADDSVILLSDQFSNEGELLPFQSLFFCKLKQIFFHPLCPNCGSALQQCYDDELLKGFGLQPYSTSTKRYLYCPLCLDSKGKSDFYVVSLENTDPETLKDCSVLIKEFGNIVGDREYPGLFPCGGCPSRGECYGAEDLALSRIEPFSFYPFFMLIFDDMSINAVDFLSLVSGASFEDLETHLAGTGEPGRISCLEVLKQKGPKRRPFFFDRDDRYFLEVLYLKISFLSEFVQTILPEINDISYPDFGISLDRIWIKISDQQGLLPFFWNFKLKLMDTVGNLVRTSSFPKMPPSYGLHLMALIWFYTLLVNRKQKISEVYNLIGLSTGEEQSDDDIPIESIVKDGVNPVISPENIFWDPDVMMETPVNDTWVGLWEKTIGLGWSLLGSARGNSAEWSREDFLQDLETIREDIKGHLFQQTAAVKPWLVQEDTAIQNILDRVMGKWRMNLVSRQDGLDETFTSRPASDKASAPPDGVFQDDVDMEKTVILSPDGRVKSSQPSVQTEDGLDETVILSTKDADGSAPSDGVLPDDTEVTHTVILSSDSPFKEAASHVQEDELDETVILSPGGIGDEIQPPVQAEDEFVETVILSPDGSSKGALSPVQTQDDDIPQTVIISPSNSEKLSGRTDPSTQSPLSGVRFEEKEPAPTGVDEQARQRSSGIKTSDKNPDDNDFLAETVILRPQGPREKE